MLDSDEEIKKNIVEKLAQDKRIEASMISIEVKNGKVTLTGEVPGAVAQSSANWITTGIPGVTDVMNQLTVRRPAALTSTTHESQR